MGELNFGNIPEHMRDSLRRYVEHGEPVGDFLRLCIINDYHGAAGAADHINQRHLLDYINFFYNEVPAIAHGSEAAYKAWCAMGGKFGKRTIANGN